MDEDTARLANELLTRVGMALEDLSEDALLINGADELPGRIARITEGLRRASAFAEAAWAVAVGNPKL